MTDTCEIKWVDANGQPTPDTNPAIGRCRVVAYGRVIHGRTIACHAKQLSEPGMEIWEFEAR